MKRILITILILAPLFSFSQNGVYHAINKDSLDYKYEIIVFNDSNYVFRIRGNKIDPNNISSDEFLKMMASSYDFKIIYSYGLIIKTDNGYILEDKTSKLKLYLNKNKEYYTIKNSPLFVSGVKFKYDSVYNSSLDNVKEHINLIEKHHKKIIKYLELYYNKDKLNHIRAGKYIDFEGRQLKLDSNKSYNLKCCGLTISRGKYKIKDNKIYFIDNDVKHTFFGKIEGKEIVITDLPICLSSMFSPFNK